MKSLRLLTSLFILVLAGLACQLPFQSPAEPPRPNVITETSAPTQPGTPPDADIPSPNQTCAPDMTLAVIESIQFCYPDAITNSFQYTFVPESPPALDRDPWVFNPEMISIELEEYPVFNLYEQARIFIYPVDMYIEMASNTQPMITDLESLLTNQTPAPENIPYLPVTNANPMVQVMPRYIDFQNGRGIRFITQFSQGITTINNDSAVYAFMGMTDDGRYIISATFPINHPMFYPDSITEPGEGWEAFAENYISYIERSKQELSDLPLESFTPDLSLLDQMMTSLYVAAEAIP